MAEVIHFTPRPELGAAANLAAFVEGARNRLAVFGADLPFDEMVWNTGDAGKQRGLSHAIRITFSTLDSRNDKAPQPMAEPFGAFAKACVRYLQGMRPVSNQQNRMCALRALEAALVENGGNANPVRLDAQTFDRAAQLIKREYTAAAAYRIGGQLEIVARLLRDKCLTAVPIAWRNSLPRPSDTEKLGEEFEQRRQDKMPKPGVLDAVVAAFLTATIPGDIIRISAVALMCASPDRIGEVLTLPAACEVNHRRGGKEDAYGLRWWPEKGARPMVKWIIPSMVGIVREATAKIVSHTAEARRIAAWYEANPDMIYLPDDMRHLRGAAFISVDDAEDLLGVTAKGWSLRNSLKTATRNRVKGFDFGDFERAVLTLLPKGFPIMDAITGLAYKDALFVVQRNQFRTNRKPSRCLVEPVVQQHISDALGGRVEHGLASIFIRLGLAEDYGKPIAINTHQFRHWLNTLAQRGGLSQLDIAKWSGRRDVRQNRAYDHMSSVEILEKVREAVVDDDRLFGPLSDLRPNAPMSRAGYAKLDVPTAHTTDFGFCIHDFAMLPCQIHRDCLNCIEHVCIKGDRAKTARIRARYDDALALSAKAERAINQDEYGANRWLDHHLATLHRLEQLVAILDDSAVPEGTVIRLGQGVHGTMFLEPEKTGLPTKEIPKLTSGPGEG